MDSNDILEIKQKLGPVVKKITSGLDEIYLETANGDFKKVCHFIHKKLYSPVMTYFCCEQKESFRLYCCFEGVIHKKWFFVYTDVPKDLPEYDTLSLEMHSAALFEREIFENFGISAKGNPDLRRLRLHDEVWPEGNYPLRKDFNPGSVKEGAKKDYVFHKIEGEGIFEVPVGPVHAGIIGPGHFRFSVAGEPVINLEMRLGFTHRGVEKLFENKYPEECLKLSECVSGDSSFAHSLAFCHAVEKINSLDVPVAAQRVRCVFLELERMYNHANDVGGIALDVGFSFAANYASIIKEKILALNERVSGSRYLKGVNVPGGVFVAPGTGAKIEIADFLDEISEEFNELKDILFYSVSFMDRVDTTGKLLKTIAQDLGMVGLCARACGIDRDLRKDFEGIYDPKSFIKSGEKSGDVLSRLKVRLCEFEESVNIIRHMLAQTFKGELKSENAAVRKEGFALGYKEGWRGPVLYWVMTDASGRIARCKIVDPSFHNWQGLSYAVRNNIVPDFPLCNKSFDLSYSGNDL
jgi:Ni,Fe-hydrogenase III large subunit/Ni,Fe-hydrogenase III component G